MRGGIKEVVGRVLLETCERMPAMKRPLKRWGMRTVPGWFPGRVVHVQLPENKRLALGSFSQNYLSFELFWKGAGYYEPITALLARELVRDAAMLLDVGANIGFYTLVLSVFKPDLRVIAFEPNPKNLALLKHNVALNGLEHVTCEPLAISDEDGTAELYLSASDMSASLESDFEGSTARIETPRVSLDSYLSRRETPGPLVIKVDVEGHEGAFFRGAQRTLQNLKPDIICEVTTTLDPLSCSVLREAGYRFYSITDEGLRVSEEPRLVVRNGLVFLNYLLSSRPAERVAGFFERIARRVRDLDLTRTSKHVSPELLTEMLARTMQRPARPG